MTKRGLILLLLLGILFEYSNLIFAEVTITENEGNELQALHPEYKEGELLVKFKEGVHVSKAQLVHKSIGSVLKKRFRITGVEHVTLPPGITVEEGISLYESLPEVEYAEPNFIVKRPRVQEQGEEEVSYLDVSKSASDITNDPYFNLQWGLYNIGQMINNVKGTFDADIDAPEAWTSHSAKSQVKDVTVALLDTGVDYEHPDLASNIWVNELDPCGDEIDNDGNGYVDDCRGWNFAYDNNNPMDDDEDGHGTHVAGIVGAIIGNNIGVCGVSPNVKLMPLKFLDKNGNGQISNVVEAIEYAITMGAKVINASYTYPQSCTKTDPYKVERDAIEKARNAGILFVAAAGNYNCNNDTYPFYPASHNLDNIISVAAIDQNGNKVSWSNYGKQSVHVAAPGVNIYSTIRRDLGSYGYMKGTSMSAPFVTGLAALIASENDEYTHTKIKERISTSVVKNSSLKDKLISGGMINAYNALSETSTTLEAPSDLLASVLSESRIDLNWVDNSTDETGFQIERKTELNGTFSAIATVSGNSTGYSDTAVREATRYYYRVRAVNFTSSSFYSNEVYVMTPPVAPSGLTATAVSSTQIDLAWVDNSNGEEGFQIERKSNETGLYTAITVLGSNAVAYSDTGVSPGITYYYRIRAFNEGGYSPYSNEIQVATPSPAVSGGGGGGGCFIATAAFGSPNDWHVSTLRQFRDSYLLTSDWGRAFVQAYYKYSPPIATYLAEHDVLRAVVRMTLVPVAGLAYVIMYQPVFLLLGFVMLFGFVGILIRKKRS